MPDANEMTASEIAALLEWRIRKQNQRLRRLLSMLDTPPPPAREPLPVVIPLRRAA